METVSSNVTIDISLIWTVVGSLVSVIGVMAAVVRFLYIQSQRNQQEYTKAIVTMKTEVMQVTRDNTEASKALIKSVEELPENLMRMSKVR